jgi:hypothetical protein
MCNMLTKQENYYEERAEEIKLRDSFIVERYDSF